MTKYQNLWHGVLVVLFVFIACSQEPGGIDHINRRSQDRVGGNGLRDGKRFYDKSLGALRIQLNLAELQVRYMKATGLALKQDPWRYEYSYLEINDQGVVNFNNAQAQLEWVNLPVDQTGDLNLRLYNDGVLRFQGQKKKVTLSPGFNKVSIELHVVDDQGVQIEIEAIIIDSEVPDIGSEGSTDNQPPADDGVYNFREHIQWSNVRTVAWSGQNHGSKYYQDVMSHTRDRFLRDEPTTNAHETMHGLLNEQRNATSARDQFIYYENGQGAYVIEPSMHASKIKNYLPAGAKNLARSRYQTYLVSQVSSWSNVLYQFDEWNCYITGARVGIEMVRANTWQGGGQDVVDGAMDFLYFASAAVAALHREEPDYLKNEQFKAVYAMLAEQTMHYVNEGLKISYFQGFHAAQLKQHFLQSPENENIRQVLRQWLGSAWTQKVFGF